MQQQNTTIRPCRRCKRVLPTENFKPNKASGFSHFCIECRSEIHRRGRYKNCPDGHKECRFCHKVKPYDQFPMMAATGIKRNTISGACFGCKDAKLRQKRERHKDGPSTFPTVKVCCRCKTERPIGHFRRDKTAPEWRKTACIECVTAGELNHPERVDHMRRYHLAHKYGLDLDDVAEMLEDQGGKCLICSVDLDFANRASQKKRAHIDHCHASGKVRGILCGVCNAKLGTVESPGFLVKALAYLKKHGVDPLAVVEVS